MNNNFFEVLINLIDVLIVILPALLAVAFMTIIERKQLAAMQRRVGPNTVGYLPKFKNTNLFQKQTKNTRFFHSSSNSINEVINTLYKNRIVPVKFFDSAVIDTCFNLISQEQRNLFFNKYNNKGGIYIIQYKADLNIYYIV